MKNKITKIIKKIDKKIEINNNNNIFLSENIIGKRKLIKKLLLEISNIPEIIFSIQYCDDELDNWTLPVYLTKNRINKIIKDLSIDKIKFILSDNSELIINI